MLVIYDEYKNKSATKRIQMFNNRRSALMYADFNVEMIDDDTYETLRRSHHKLSKKEHVVIALVSYFLIAIYSLVSVVLQFINASG